MREELRNGINWLKAGEPVRLAIVTETWGSAPRPEGSLLFVGGDGKLSGSVSGGCIEGDVLATALAMGDRDTPTEMAFGVTNEDAWAAGLACGGEIRVALTPLTGADIDTLEQFQARLLARQKPALILDKNIKQLRLAAHDSGRTHVTRLDADGQVIDGKTDAKAARITLAAAPLPHLVIAGVVHLSEILCQMARLADYDITLIDPRPAFTEGRTLDGVRIIADWPDLALEKEPLDSLSAVIALTHDPKIDDLLLASALNSDAYYIGALGSHKSHAARLDRLRGQGFADQELARINGPVGLAIGSKGPAEIATSILAEVIAEYRAKFFAADVQKRTRNQDLRSDSVIFL